MDIAANLRAAASHIEQHPHLADNAPSLIVQSGRKLRVQVYPHRAGDTHLSALAEWATTLTDPRPVRVHHHANSDVVDLTLIGATADGLPVEIVALPDPDELDLLAANTPMDEGALIPVELLLRLTSAAVAEAVTS